MKTITLEDGTLCLDGDILKGAEEAFKETRYVEAFALLHAYIDWCMTNLIQLDGCIVDSSKTGELLFNTKYRFKNSLNTLKKEKIINENERQQLIKFDDLRNLIIHRLVTRSYGNRPKIYSKLEPNIETSELKITEIEVETNRVTIDEVKKGFEEGINLAQLLRGKSASVIAKKASDDKT